MMAALLRSHTTGNSLENEDRRAVWRPWIIKSAGEPVFGSLLPSRFLLQGGYTMRGWLLLIGVVFFVLSAVSQGHLYRQTKSRKALGVAVGSVFVAILMSWATILAFRQP
jgi:hypothetical protein